VSPDPTVLEPGVPMLAFDVLRKILRERQLVGSGRWVRGGADTAVSALRRLRFLNEHQSSLSAGLPARRPHDMNRMVSQSGKSGYSKGVDVLLSTRLTQNVRVSLRRSSGAMSDMSLPI
jgi:hypothetical protein